MNILSISSILPIPNVFETNDFVFQTYLNYLRLYKDDKVLIIKPVKISFNLIHIFKGNTRLKKLNSRFQWDLNGFDVIVFPFLSAWGFRNIHSILCKSIFYLNRKKIKEILSLYQFNIIHAQYIFSDGMLAYLINKKYNIPYVITTHNERYYFDHFLSGRIAFKILNNASHVIPINYTNAEFYKSIGLKNVEHIPLGFNKGFLKPKKKSNSEKVRILTVSVLTKLKNIDKVINAIQELVLNYDISYTIIGKGPEKENLLNLVEKLQLSDYILFKEHIPHESIAEEMYNYDIFIMPSFFETFGRVYFECMAMGIPIICAKDSGIFGIFQEREEGLSVNHTDIKDISEALEFLISNPEERVRIGLNGQKLVGHYTWENVVKSLHSIYNHAIIQNF